MDVSCEHCQSRFKIPDEKIPENQAFSLSCPKCKKKITVGSQEEPTVLPSKPSKDREKTLMDEVASGSYNASDRPFDFLEEGAETALICESDASMREKINAALKNLGYQITVPKNARDVLKKMRFHVFDLVVINEMFDTRDPDQNNILRHLERMSMDTRRDMFVVLVSDRFRTMDNMVAFNRSVNLVINMVNVDEVEKIIKRGLTDHMGFYKIYRDSLLKAGRA